MAEENAPSIIFIDEIDAVGTKRYVLRYSGPICKGSHTRDQIRFHLRRRKRNPEDNARAAQSARWI